MSLIFYMWLWLDDRGHADNAASQLRGWVRPPWWTSSSSRSASHLDNITIDVPGVYVIYSKITFGCGGDRDSFRDVNGSSISHSYQHKIDAVDGRGGRSVYYSL